MNQADAEPDWKNGILDGGRHPDQVSPSGIVGAGSPRRQADQA